MTTTATTTKPQPHDQRRRLPALAVVLGVVGLAAAGGWILFSGDEGSPRALLPHDQAGFRADPRPVSRAGLTVAVTMPSDRSDRSDAPVAAHTLTFHDVRTHLRANTARASVTYWICGHAKPVAFGRGDVTGQCPSLVPIVDGTRFAYPSSDRYVVAVITPTRPGRTRLVGADFSYSVGGTEVTDPVRLSAVVRATPDARS